MELAIISDIHGNLEALLAVVEHIRKEKIPPENTYCLGDVVGYGPFPKECIEIVKRECMGGIILGNHDEAAIAPSISPFNFNDVAKTSIEWTGTQFGSEEREELARYRKSIRKGDILFFHAMPDGGYDYIGMEGGVLERASDLLADQRIRLGFFGHSHIPFVATRQNQCNGNYLKKHPIVEVRCDEPVLINVGSAGQPRDGNPQACYVIYNPQYSTVTFMRVEYDVSITTSAIHQRMEIPKDIKLYLVTRLFIGV